MEMILFSGTSNLPLALAVAKHLKLPLGNIEITRFIDNECRVYIKEDVADKHVYVIQSLSQVADQNLVELCLIGQALKSLKAKHVTAVIPWMGYSKQDKEFRKGEAVSVQLVARFIESAGFDSVITVELHSENLIPFFKIPIRVLSTHELLSRTLSDILRARSQRRVEKSANIVLDSSRRNVGALSNNNFVVVSPDSGGKSRSEHFARTMKLPIVYLEKSRDLSTGNAVVTGINGSVKDKEVIIFDDIINTGATAIKTSEFLKKHGAAKIYFLATHAVLAGDACSQLAQSSIDEIIVTDTIQIPDKAVFSKLHIVSAASLLSRAIAGSVE